jgi:hypothetical protein
MISIADVAGKPPTESVFFEKYSRIACVIDEVLNEVSKDMADGTMWVCGVGIIGRQYSRQHSRQYTHRLGVL